MESTSHFHQRLLIHDNERSRAFFKNIRAYNCHFSFVSLGGVQLDKRLDSSQKGPYCFSIQGSIYHCIGSLMPNEGSNPLYDFDKQLDQCISIFQGLDREVITGIQSALNETHPYIQFLRCAREKWIEAEPLMIKLVDDRSKSDKQYCQPTAAEVVIIMTDSDSIIEDHRDIILTTKENQLKNIDELNPAFDPLAYYHLFGGNSGFQLYLPHKDGTKNTTIQGFYAY
jgi:hypothetical protein